MISELTWTKRRRLLGATVIGLVLIAGLSVLGNTGGTAKAAILTPIGEPVGGETLFYDDFSNETYTNESWIVVSGTWAIENEEYSQSDEGVRGISQAGESTWTDFTVEAKVTIKSGVGAGIEFRVQGNDTYYRATLSVGSNKLWLHKRMAGVFSEIASVSLTVNTDTTYILKIIVEGWNCKIFVDDVQKIPAIGWQDLTGHNLASGKIGLETYKAHTHFDNLKVSEPVTLIPSAYSLKVRAGVTQIVITCTWSGSGNITIANLTSLTTIYYESNMSIYEKATVSVQVTTSIFNMRRALLAIAATMNDETWTLHLNLNEVTTYQVSAETS